MNDSSSLNLFKIPMLGKFLGGAMQNTNGQFIMGEVYVITGYNPDNNSVQTTGMTSRNRWIDASAFEVVRNNMWTFQQGHLAGMEGIIGDIAKFEDPKHDDVIEALSCSPFMHVDLSSSPDYSVTGRYIGNRWPELHEQVPARRLTADEYPELKLSQEQYDNLECRTAAFIHQSPQKETNRERYEREIRENHPGLFGKLRAEHHAEMRRGKSHYNHIFATGHVDAIRVSEKARRFADMFNSKPEHLAPTADIAEAILAATTAMMGVSPKLVGPNCRCVMPELKKGLHSESTGMFVLDDTYAGQPIYASQLEDGKPTHTATFVRDTLEASDKLKKTITARLQRGLNEATMAAMGVQISGEYNRMVECTQNIGSYVKGCTYRAIAEGGHIKVEHPDTSVAMPVPRNHFRTIGPIPCSVDDRDAPSQPRFQDESYGPKDSSPEETTFDHKLTTRKAQDTHVDTDETAELRKYRYNPDTF